MKTRISLIIIALMLIGSCIYAYNNERDEALRKSEVSQSVDLREFELVRDSLYDYSYTIAKALIIDNESGWYYDIDPETVKILKTYKVPNLHVILCALDEIDDNGDLADIYDDDEGTLFKYDRKRLEYENFFKTK